MITLFFTVFAAFAVFGAAAPNVLARQASENMSAQVGDSCGSHSSAYCCNSETSEKLVSKDTLANADIAKFQNLLGQCNDITVAVFGGALSSPLEDTCTQQAVCCGDMKQDVSFRPNNCLGRSIILIITSRVSSTSAALL